MNKLLLLPLLFLLFACSQKAETETEKSDNNAVNKFQFEQIERAKELENIQQQRDKQIKNILDSQENKTIEQ